MREFVVAAQKTEQKDLELLEIPFGPKTLYVKRPTSGQIAMFGVNAREAGTVGGALRFLDQILVTDVDIITEALTPEADGDEIPEAIDVDPESVGDVFYLRDLLENGAIGSGTLFGGDADNPKGLCESIVEEWVGRPTRPSSASSASPKGTGRRSTRAPGKGSTASKGSSRSPQTGS